MEINKETYGELERTYHEAEPERIESLAWEFKDDRKKADMHIAVDSACGDIFLENIRKLVYRNNCRSCVDSSSINPRTTQGLGAIIETLLVGSYRIAKAS